MEDGVFVKPQSQLVAKVDYTEFSVEHYSDNVLLVHYKAPHDVDIALIEKVNTEIYRMVAEQPYVVIVFAEPGVNFTPEGRAYGAKKGHIGNKKAWAAVTENLAQILVVNFFMRFNSPTIPFKLFKTEKEARKWLNTFM